MCLLEKKIDIILYVVQSAIFKNICTQSPQYMKRYYNRLFLFFEENINDRTDNTLFYIFEFICNITPNTLIKDCLKNMKDRMNRRMYQSLNSDELVMTWIQIKLDQLS